MGPPPRFRSDLYRDTARFYHQYRVPYPAALVDDIVCRTGTSGSGRLLDLACGPGRVTFALCNHFREVVAVDQEEESVRYASALAEERGIRHVRWRAGRAEDLDMAGPFDLVTIGDAFHRLDRSRVAARVRGWLPRAGHVALLWTSMPWQGSAPWQRAALGWVEHWMQVTGSIENIPADLAESLTRTPHLTVLNDAGLEVVGSFAFTAPHVWTFEALTGFAHSTSILSRPALGARVAAFEHDLRDRLLAVKPDGRFEDLVSFTYDLAVKP